MEFTIKTSQREEIVDITDKVKEIAEKEIQKDKNTENAKVCLVYVKHTTCSIIITENTDKAVCEDILDFLKKQIPQGIWKHDKQDNNADAHIKSALLGVSQLIPLKNGKLILGTWQGIALAEFDGPRERKVIVEVI